MGSRMIAGRSGTYGAAMIGSHRAKQIRPPCGCHGRQNPSIARNRLMRQLLILMATFVSASAAQGSSLSDLRAWLRQAPLNDERFAELPKQAFASESLTKSQAKQAADLIWAARSEQLREERKAEMVKREIVLGDKKMPFWFKTFGKKPASGHSLFISMHGGGGAPPAVNTQQYENQKRLYQPAEGIYLVPRAPTDTWNLWHQGHIDAFFDRIITNMVIFHDVNPDRVYIMGYSAGGDGVYQLAPRMADRLAAAAMMAGHPNETKPDGLRNIGFTLHMGALDGAYRRNQIAAEWKEKLAALRKSDPSGYQHHVEIHPGRAHWMNLEDRVAVPWMAKFTRNRFPSRIVWLQDDVTHQRFYWLRTSQTGGRPRIVAEVRDNSISIPESDVQTLTVLLHDDFVSLDKPIRIVSGEAELFDGTVERTIATIAQSIAERDEPGAAVYASVSVKLPANADGSK